MLSVALSQGNPTGLPLMERGMWGKLLLLPMFFSRMRNARVGASGVERSVTRVNDKTGPPPAPRVPADPRLLETDLGDWAGERIAKGGRQDALLGRVEALRLSLDGASVEARVRGNRPLPYTVMVAVASGSIDADCTCSREAPGPCRHAVAAIEALRFPSPASGAPLGGARPRRGTQPTSSGRGRIIQHAPAASGFVLMGNAERTLSRDERIALAREEELALRRHRARRDKAKVVVLAQNSGPPRFEVSPRRAGDSTEVVTLRGARGELGSCTCSDFESAELQTCAHIERVSTWYWRQRKNRRPDLLTETLSLWSLPRPRVERIPELLEEIRCDLPEGQTEASLNRYFDSRGWLRSAPDSVALPAWAREARRASERAAVARGWGWDLDPTVEARIAERESEEALSRCRATADSDEELWHSVTSQLRLTLHPYQEIGARFIAREGRAFLADDMGLGKTIQAIAAALLLRRTTGCKKVLVVCPASLKHQWRREIDKTCDARAAVVEGPRPRRLATYEGWKRGFLILNYELVLRDLDAIRRAGADLVVLDEAQRIKNWDTKTARAIKQLRSPHAFILTGTPLENRLMELHSLVEFLHPRAPGPRWRLLPFHAVTESHGRVIAYEGLDVLRRRLASFFLRRDRRDVLDQLPERTDNTFWTGMTLAQRRPYRKQVASLARIVSGRQPLQPPDVNLLLRALTNMRILCNAHAQFAWDRFSEVLASKEPADAAALRALGSPKLEEFARALEDLLDESQEKIVVFSQWERMLRLAHYSVRGLLEQRDLRAEVFHGGLTSRARGEMLDAFRLDPEFRVLFSTDAGGLGLNLQEAASIVVNLEVPWNPAILEQRIGRVHRIGQLRSVQVLHFVTRDAIEERVRQVVEQKRALFQGLFVDRKDEVSLVGSESASFLDQVRALIANADAPAP
jgi:superfamily II DNA or RNA helicase